MTTKTTYIDEIQDPVTGELIIEAESPKELDTLVAAVRFQVAEAEEIASGT